MADTDNLWQMYAQQILAIASSDFDPSHQQFSIASSTLSVDLGNADPAVDNAYIFHMGNTIPAASPAYAPGSGLLTAYRLFLDSIDLKGDPNPNLDSQINIAASNLTAAQTNFGNVQAQTVQAWNTYKVFNPNISIQDYITQQYPLYTQARNALRAAEAQYGQLMTQRYGVGYEVIAEARDKVGADGGAADVTIQNSFNMAIKSGAVAAAGALPALPGVTPEGPASALIPSFAPAFSLDGFTTVYQEWQAESAGKAKPQASVTLDSSSTGSGWTDSGWSADGSGGFGSFLSVWARPRHRRIPRLRSEPATISTSRWISSA